MNVKVNSTILLSQFNLFTTREVSAIIPPLRNFQVIAKKYVCPTADDLCCIFADGVARWFARKNFFVVRKIVFVVMIRCVRCYVGNFV